MNIVLREICDATPGKVLRAYEIPADLRKGLARYFDFYNAKCRYSALDSRPPDAVYFDQDASERAA